MVNSDEGCGKGLTAKSKRIIVWETGNILNQDYGVGVQTCVFVNTY